MMMLPEAYADYQGRDAEDCEGAHLVEGFVAADQYV